MMDVDLNLHEEGVDPDEYGEDYYETQAGDDISGVPLIRARKNAIGFGLVAFGFVLVFGGISAAIMGNEERAKTSEYTNDYKTKHPSIENDRPRETQEPEVESPTRAPVAPKPVAAPVEPVTVTHAPSNSPAFSLLSSIIGSDLLLDPDSLPNSALSWLNGNADLATFDSNRVKQRFALASLFLATNNEDTGGWTSDEGWMTDENECDWYGVICQDNFLISLNLTANGLHGNVPFEISLLSDTLLALVLNENILTNKDGGLAWMGELKRLRMLQVADTYMEYHGIPTYIKKLTDLRVLDVSNTLFFGELDGSIFKHLDDLLYLELGGNSYNSTIPHEIINLPRLEALYMYDCGLKGDFEFISNLGPIFEIWLDDNKDLHGTLPTEIGTLTTMASLSLSNCNLEGQLPTELGALTLMEQMWFFGNWLTGTVPTEIGHLHKLQIFAIEDNNITDTSMPNEICSRDPFSVSADCNDEWGFTCDCCSCCNAPCPVANLPLYSARNNPARFLF